MSGEGGGMNIDRYIGWTLVFAALFLLATRGKLDLLVILLPLSLLLACGIGCFARRKIPADVRHQKEVA